MSEQDDELIEIFIEESREHLEGIEDNLLRLEEQGINLDDDLINKVFRAIHSIKGAAGFFGYDATKSLAHATENVLGKIRKRELIPSKPIIVTLLKAVEVLKEMMATREEMSSNDVVEPMRQLEQILTQSVAAPSSGTVGSPLPKPAAPEKFGDNVSASQRMSSASPNRPRNLASAIPVSEDVLDIRNRWGTHVFSVSKTALKDATEQSQGGPCVYLIEFGDVKKADIKNGADNTVSRQAAKPPGAASYPDSTLPQTILSSESASPQGKTEGSIRVNVKILDRLTTLAGEMVLTRNQLLQNLQNNDDEKKLQRAAQRVDVITTELRDAIMSTCMQSVGIIFSRFRRIVHDMSRDLGKEIDLELEGEDVELDKSIMEAIGAPLTHLVRNAVDHGIEQPQERISAGKTSCGHLRLSAFHKAGQVMIEVTDDGKGLDPNAIKDKAVAMGLYTPQELDKMPEHSILRLIFKPGFSTATEVTETSGMGMSMAVVSSNLSNVGGVVDLESEPGKGTTVRVKLPVTLAILPALMVEVGGEQFAIPQMNLMALQRIPAAKVARTIEKLGSIDVMRLRGELLPLINLRDVLKIPQKQSIHSAIGTAFHDDRQTLADRREQDIQLPASEEKRMPLDPRRHPPSAVNIAVVAAGEFNYGIIVDKLLDSEEIVVKPLGRHLSDCRIYAGATVLGNGRAALILDVVGISQVMELMNTADAKLSKRCKDTAEDANQTDRQSLLLIENAKDDILAIPLGLVERVEKVSKRDIQKVAGRRTIKYRGGSLMLFAIEDVVAVDPICQRSDVVFVIVSKIAGREAGIMCSAIVDTIDADITIDEVTHRDTGVFGSAVIQDRITLLLNIHSIVTETVPNWVGKAASRLKPNQIDNIDTTPKMGTTAEALPQILIVENSTFFMNQIRATVEQAGFTVLTAQDGLEALDVLRQNHIDLVLTDIEMPNLDGFGLVERMRADSTFAHIPAIAVTSVMADMARTRSRQSGIDEYLTKLDLDQILERSIYYLNHGRRQATM